MLPHLFSLLALVSMDQPRPRQVVTLDRSQVISASFGGKILQLKGTTETLSLPSPPPRVDADGQPWAVEIRNLGPGSVLVLGGQFSLRITSQETAQIVTKDGAYRLVRTQRF